MDDKPSVKGADSIWHGDISWDKDKGLFTLKSRNGKTYTRKTLEQDWTLSEEVKPEKNKVVLPEDGEWEPLKTYHKNCYASAISNKGCKSRSESLSRNDNWLCKDCPMLSGAVPAPCPETPKPEVETYHSTCLKGEGSGLPCGYHNYKFTREDNPECNLCKAPSGSEETVKENPKAPDFYNFPLENLRGDVNPGLRRLAKNLSLGQLPGNGMSFPYSNPKLKHVSHMTDAYRKELLEENKEKLTYNNKSFTYPVNKYIVELLEHYEKYPGYWK